ncbi:DUF4198 domain-containing protein [Stenotrophomonas maltophilia]|uniref:DUF4198 domain-containing protein n=1 Tax=Stenotrophomonas maltophilia TaxID=40324 RepID=UPI00115FAD12|nr:DUF4198 domain-containing protein [Stenotrophomonas maltophilia]
MHIFKMLIALSLFIATSAIAAQNRESLALIKQLAIQPIALVDGDLCHIRGAVWLDEPIANVEVEIIDGINTWKTRTDLKGIYTITIPHEGIDKALIERPSNFLINTQENNIAVLKPTIICSKDLTNRSLNKPKGATNEI